jgi:uncharacterized protein (DUF2252 family)
MATTASPPLTAHEPDVAERRAAGKAARASAARSDHADWVGPIDRPDPVDLLEEQAATRVPDLVPIRYGRMAVSPFAFFRGAAYVMASDLAETPVSGLRVQLCGDGHLSNFGGFGAPDRTMVFDVNDFDETLPGPWEWDVKRLAASLAVASRQRGFSKKERDEIVRDGVGTYRSAMRRFAAMTPLDVWYSRLGAAAITETFASHVKPAQLKRFEKTVAKAKTKDSARAFEKLGCYVNGSPRIQADPPLLVPIADIAGDAEAGEIEHEVAGMIDTYRNTLSGDRRLLLDRYRYADLARKVVGVGSVGARAWVVLMTDRDTGAPLFLQAKEAGPSVLERFAGRSKFENQGRRVVEGQRLMQAASDIFLGWLRVTGLDGVQRDFYIRQLWDWKSSADVESMDARAMSIYAKLCGWTLARGHARSGDAIAIAAYLGSSDAFDKAITRFAETYADQNERDHIALIEAIDDGRIPAQTGV